MPRPVTPDDVAVRTFELPLLEQAPYDAVVMMDGPETGPFQIYPQNLTSGSVNRTTSRTGQPPAGSEIYIQPPTGFAHWYPIEDVLGQGSNYYLGPATTVPTTNSQGLPVQPGNTYFDLNTNQMMVLGTDLQWRLSGQPVPAAARRYVWTITGTITSLPATDDYGNTLDYDAAYPEQTHLYVNGARQIGGLDYTLGPPLTMIVAVVAGDIVEILVHIPPIPDYIAAPVAIDTSLWVPNGVTLAFPLKDQLGRDVIPVSARGADLWLLASPDAGPDVPAGVWRQLAPGIEYSIAGATVTFTAPPPVTALLQMTVWQLDPQERASLLATADFTLDQSYAGALITGTVTGVDVAVPSAATLGAGFYCDFLVDGFTITLTFPGAGTLVLTNNQMVRLFTANGKLRTGAVETTVIRT